MGNLVARAEIKSARAIPGVMGATRLTDVNSSGLLVAGHSASYENVRLFIIESYWTKTLEGELFPLIKFEGYIFEINTELYVLSQVSEDRYQFMLLDC